MTAASAREKAYLRITGSETADNTVPVDVLARALQGLQQTALLLAAANEQGTVARRFRPSEQLRRRCELRCGPPPAGSVAVSIGFAQPASVQPSLFPEAVEEPLLERLFRFVEAVAAGDANGLSKVLPDSRLRTRALRETLNYLPRAGQRWELELGQGEGPPIQLNQQTRQIIEDWFRADDAETMIVTGPLIRIDFDKKRVIIRYPPTRKMIACDYEVDAEDVLIKNRREWVQAHGSFELDREKNPWKAMKVTRIEPLDLSPMSIETLEQAGRTFILTPPLELQPALDQESKQLLVVEDRGLDLHAFAPTREELQKEIVTHLLFLWDECMRKRRRRDLPRPPRRCD